MRKTITTFLIAAGAVLACASSVSHAQSEVSVAISLLPVASVVGTASVATGMAGASVASVAAVPVALSVGGAVLTVKAVESTARGTVFLLERASDGAQASVEVGGAAAASTFAAVGTVVTVSVIGCGVLLSAAGEVLAFVPNAIGRALLHNERLTMGAMR